jgi:uncharacterized membrane protein
MPGTAFWLYFSGTLLLVIGLIKIGKAELPQTHRFEKIMPFRRLFLAIPMGVFGTEHLTNTADIANIVPRWMPAHPFWVYLVGIALIAAALSITVKIPSRLAATLPRIMLCLFVVLIHIPNILAHPSDRFVWTVGLRDIAFSGGAFAFAGSQMGGSGKRTCGVSWLVTVAQFPAVFFGIEHFLHATFAPGVPLEKIAPSWIPGPLFWAYLAGTVLVAAGTCIIANKKARQAASYLGITILLLVLFVFLPILAAGPYDIVSLLQRSCPGSGRCFTSEHHVICAWHR